MSGSGVMARLLAVLLPGGQLRCEVEILTFLFTDIEGSRALLGVWETTITRRCWPAIMR